MVIEEFTEEHDYKIKFICGNDDSVYAVGNDDIPDNFEYDLADFEEIDSTICTNLGLYIHPSKSFFSYHWVFFEEYSHPNFIEKSCLPLMALAKGFFAPSIYWAKTLTASIFSNIENITTE